MLDNFDQTVREVALRCDVSDLDYLKLAQQGVNANALELNELAFRAAHAAARAQRAAMELHVFYREEHHRRVAAYVAGGSSYTRAEVEVRGDGDLGRIKQLETDMDSRAEAMKTLARVAMQRAELVKALETIEINLPQQEQPDAGEADGPDGAGEDGAGIPGGAAEAFERYTGRE